MVNLAVQGIGGRMGQAVLENAAQRSDCRVVAGIEKQPTTALPCPVFTSAAKLPDTVDVLIDFSHPDASLAAVQMCAERGLPCVVCTTGFADDTWAVFEHAAQKTAVFHSANMSLGINVLAKLARQAAQLLPGYDIEIVEKHHRNKLDAPSGTALLLADAINTDNTEPFTYVFERHTKREVRGAHEIGFSAVRGGSIVGEHEVLLAGPDEVVSLGHVAYSRGVFAAGAIAAALFLKGKAPGLYSMDDLLCT